MSKFHSGEQHDDTHAFWIESVNCLYMSTESLQQKNDGLSEMSNANNNNMMEMSETWASQVF